LSGSGVAVDSQTEVSKVSATYVEDTESKRVRRLEEEVEEWRSEVFDVLW
jgi:hypothetical protein